MCTQRCRVVILMVDVFFFFQAEDGIRDLVRSRGLGDVYKRQVDEIEGDQEDHGGEDADGEIHLKVGHRGVTQSIAVSYTHLTLPTSDLV